MFVGDSDFGFTMRFQLKLHCIYALSIKVVLLTAAELPNQSQFLQDAAFFGQANNQIPYRTINSTSFSTQNFSTSVGGPRPTEPLPLFANRDVSYQCSSEDYGSPSLEACSDAFRHIPRFDAVITLGDRSSSGQYEVQLPWRVMSGT